MMAFRLILIITIFNLDKDSIIYLSWSFKRFETYRFDFLILLDYIRLIFIRSVLLISISVYIFRVSYMANEKRFFRFHLILSVFVLRMILLVLRPRILRCLLGWDGLGLSSYLLVIHYSNTKAYNSGIVTALTNRLGDGLLLLVIGVQVLEQKWFFYSWSDTSRWKLWLWVFILARFTKRAQVPFSAWLPAAMAAPTPVSSLVHSSTLVTAGVYLIIRFNHVFSDSKTIAYLIAVGLFTTLLARTAALVEVDLKKIVALSTLSQLGVIVSMLGVGLPLIRFWHLVAHAFFKALIFLATGNIIHVAQRGQDLRWIGSYRAQFRFTKSSVILSNFSLIGLPFVSAFFSKEILLEYSLQRFGQRIQVFWFYISVVLTTVYALRFISTFYISHKKNIRLNYLREKDWSLISRIVILIIPGLFTGYYLSNYISELIAPTGQSGTYLLVLLGIAGLFGYSIRLWGAYSLTAKSFYSTLNLTIWGVSLLTSKIGQKITLNFSTIPIANDWGPHASTINKIPSILSSSFSFSLLSKNLGSSFLVVIAWGLVSLIYYLNNKLNTCKRTETRRD